MQRLYRVKELGALFATSALALPERRDEKAIMRASAADHERGEGVGSPATGGDERRLVDAVSVY